MLKSVPRLVVPLNLMLAECYSHLGSDEQRLNALRQAAEGERSRGIHPHRIRAGSGQSR